MLLTKQDPPPTLDHHPNGKLVDFLSKCLLKDPAQRSAARDLENHKFIKSKKKKAPKQLLAAIEKHREMTQDVGQPRHYFPDITLRYYSRLSHSSVPPRARRATQPGAI